MATKPKIKMLVTDLDNTLYDWLSSQVPAFYAMIEAAAAILDVNSEQLLDDIKLVHQRYHSSERPLAILETVLKKFPMASPAQRLGFMKDALEVYGRVRDQNLRIFPTVPETLEAIASKGCPIVGYTEALVDNTLHRLTELRLFDCFHQLYASRNLADEDRDSCTWNNYGSCLSRIRLLPVDHRKPDPSILLTICAEHNVRTNETLYVGDSRLRDMAMAKQARVIGVWASYGCNYDRHDLIKLVRISHFSEEDIDRERQLEKSFQGFQPEFTITSFSDLLDLFEFEGFKSRADQV